MKTSVVLVLGGGNKKTEKTAGYLQTCFKLTFNFFVDRAKLFNKKRHAEKIQMKKT